MSTYAYEKKFDIVILGGGIIGASVAYYLAKLSGGKAKVALVERNIVCEETSCRSAGMLASQIEAEASGPFLDLLLASRKLYAEAAAEVKALSGIDPHFQASGILALAREEEKEKIYRSRFEWQKSVGLKAEWWTPEQIAAKFPFLKSGARGGLWLPDDGQVTAGEMGDAFAQAATKLGVQIFENEECESLDLSGPKLKGIETNLSRFVADKYVIAAGSWTGKLLKDLVPVVPVKGQLLIYDMPEDFRKRGWTEPIYVGPTPGGADLIPCYLVPKAEGELMVGATVEERGFDKSENEHSTARMKAFAAELLPDLPRFKYVASWQGLRPASPDRRPVLGGVPGFDDLFVASGHFRNGIILAPITGKLMAELLLNGKPSMPLDAFSPGRFAAAAK